MVVMPRQEGRKFPLRCWKCQPVLQKSIMRSLPWTGAVNSKICELLRSEKPLPQCFSDPSRLGGAILLFACGFDGMWLKCCWCPKQRWATQMAVGFLLSSKGGNWGLVNSLTAAVPLSRLSVTCLKSFPLLSILFPLYLAEKWPPADLLSQGRDASRKLAAPITVISR